MLKYIMSIFIYPLSRIRKYKQDLWLVKNVQLIQPVHLECCISNIVFFQVKRFLSLPFSSLPLTPPSFLIPTFYLRLLGSIVPIAFI